jgi:STE24 endopeptidase
MLVDELVHYTMFVAIACAFLVAGNWLNEATAFRSWAGERQLSHVFVLGTAFTFVFMLAHLLVKQGMCRWRRYQVVDPTGDVNSAVAMLSQFRPAMILGSLLGVSLLMGLFYVLVYWTMWNLGAVWWIAVAAVACIRDLLSGNVVSRAARESLLESAPLDNATLCERLNRVGQSVGVDVEKFYTVDDGGDDIGLAYVTACRPAQIYLGKALLRDFSAGEVTAVVAHELGHVVLRHVFRQRVLWVMTTLVVYAGVHHILGYAFAHDELHPVSSLPVFLIAQTLLQMVFKPIALWVSRRHEYEADCFARSHQPDDWRMALLKLAALSGEEPSPSPWMVYWTYSHPAMARRLANAAPS